MPLYADLLGLCGRGPDHPRPLARRFARRPAVVQMPSLGRIGLRPGPAPRRLPRRKGRVRTMIELTFPDGQSRQFEDGSSGRDVARSISPSLEKRALLIKLDSELLDLDRPLPSGGAIE